MQGCTNAEWLMDERIISVTCKDALMPIDSGRMFSIGDVQGCTNAEWLMDERIISVTCRDALMPNGSWMSVLFR